MSKIDNIYIDRAKRIRKDYLSLNDKLKKYDVYIKKLKDEIEDTIQYIQNIIENGKTGSNETIKNELLIRINNLETQIEKIQKYINPVNEMIKKLQTEEQILYEQIKIKYPNMTDDEILNTIQKEIINI